jgi:DNA-binding NtrC family response regulator
MAHFVRGVIPSPADGKRPIPALLPHVLVVDDDVRMRRYLSVLLAERCSEVTLLDSSSDVMKTLRAGVRPDILIVSSSLPDWHLPDLVNAIRNLRCRAKIVVLAHAYECAKLLQEVGDSIWEVLLKPFAESEIAELFQRFRSTSANLGLGQDVLIENDTFVCVSPVMREIRQQALRVARIKLPVLILGESGTGKEVLARFIHSSSPQANAPFLKVNCAAVPSELLESELFGYEQGAFTGASRAKLGKFQLCKDGTMFLDEIGEMPSRLQAKLLQVLQDGTFSPLGSRGTARVSVRVIAATNIDIEAAMKQKIFREDLYYRLNGISFRLPPLRDRREEIPLLVQYFLHKHANALGMEEPPDTLPARLLRACNAYTWPGNLRELENFILRYLALGDEQLSPNALLPEEDKPNKAERGMVREEIIEALEACGGHRGETAKRLGISYKVLARRMRMLGFESTRMSSGSGRESIAEVLG